MKSPLTELLAPAGSPAALDAALENGADAVYLGATAFNARMNAQNFTKDDLKSGIRRAHALGCSVYMTLNTQVLDRELPALLDTAREAYDDGIDALIVADLGAARAIRRILPAFPLHASTQMSGHSTDMARLLASCGYTRMVLARETSAEDIRSFCENAPIEAEVFVHGALCVSHSGQCLFSSVVGGRSGNRGACAQPCRLPFNGNSYPLSLRDLCLAREIPMLREMGVASLKIEGRMKSPEYVGAVTAVYRRLLDENRAASDEEVAYLAEVFSRGGFTSGYFSSRIGAEMLGVRSEADKETSRTLPPFRGLTKKAAISLSFTASEGSPIALTAEKNGKTVTVTGDIPPPAEKAPTDEETVRRQLSKLGGTVYEARDVKISLSDSLMIPVSWLNALRRDAVSALETIDASPLTGRHIIPSESRAEIPPKSLDALRSARFLSPAQITEKARRYFDVSYLPLFSYSEKANGVLLPPVVYDSKRERVKIRLCEALARGARHILVTNLGQLSLAQEAISESGAEAITLHGDFRLGVTNTQSLAMLYEKGLDRVILSPELTLPQARDVARAGPSDLIVYGRLPLMLLEKCVNIGRNGQKKGAPCASCESRHGGNDPLASCIPSARLVDRRRVEFPVLREWEHRNVVYNSLPTYMADRTDELLRARIGAHHYIFSVEAPDEVDRVIRAYEKHLTPKGQVRRLPQ